MADAHDVLSSSAALVPILRAAHEELMRLNHRFIGTEHILLALISLDQAIADLLASHGLTQDGARELVQSIRGSAEFPGEGNLLGRRAALVLEHVAQSSQAGESKMVNSAHLLLGILAVPDSLAVGMLRSRGVDLVSLTGQVRDLIESSVD